MVALQSLTPEQLAAVVPALTAVEARKVVSAVHRGAGLAAPVRQVRRQSLAAVREVGFVPGLARLAERSSRLDPFVKLVLGTADGLAVETVRIPLERPGRFSVCVSSQAGCALGCAFCATGRRGLARNLAAWEIVEQVRAVRSTLDLAAGQRVHGVVFQGMGEPMANLDSVLAAIRVLSDPCAQAIDARAVTVCSVGVPEGIRRLAKEAPKVRLGVSIGSARAHVRARLMPAERAWPLDEVLDAAADYVAATGLAPMWAVTLLDGVNDGPEDAAELADRAVVFARRTGTLPRISVVAYNATDAPGIDPFRRSAPEREAAFRDVLAARGVPSIRRYSGGADVAAACGQLEGSLTPL